MNQKKKRYQGDFMWTPLELKGSKGIDSLPQSLQAKLSTRTIKVRNEKLKQP
jgi:hypothetical protein